MQIKILGRIINLFAKGANCMTCLCYIFMTLLFGSLMIVLFVPGFQLNQEGFVTSSDGLLATAQAVVGATLLGSMVISVILGALAFLFIPEIFVELIFRKQALKLIQEKHTMSISEMSSLVGINEQTLWMMLMGWTTAPMRNRGIGKHILLDHKERTISWQD